MPEPERFRILLADDQILFVESLKSVLEERAQDFDVVGIAHDGEEAVSLAATLAPDVILMDVRMPRMDGVQAARRIHELHPAARIVMLTTFDDDDYVEVALKFGAIGYLLKNIPPNELIRALRSVRSGVTQISPEILEKLLSRRDQAKAAHPGHLPPGETLTNREREILDLIADAYENHQIATRLGISEQTVKNYVHSLYEKLGVSNRIQLMKIMGHHGGEARGGD
jgi:DNA-binding NarL/FixJ family response regulator